MNSDGIHPCLTRTEFALFNKAFWDLGFPEPISRVTTKHFLGSHQARNLAEPGDGLGLLPQWNMIRWVGPTDTPPAEYIAQQAFAVWKVLVHPPAHSLGTKRRNRSFPGGSAGKESPYNAGDLGSIPGLGRSPGEGNSYQLQYSGLENSMDYAVHGVAKSQTRLSTLTHRSQQGGKLTITGFLIGSKNWFLGFGGLLTIETLIGKEKHKKYFGKYWRKYSWKTELPIMLRESHQHF